MGEQPQPAPKKKRMSASELLRRKLFAVYLVRNGGNATQAARDVGVSEASAAEMGSRWLREVETQALVEAERKRVAEKTGLSTERVVSELFHILTADLVDAMDEHGALKPLKEWPEPLRRALSGIENEEVFEYEEGKRIHVGTLRKVKFWSKTDSGRELLRVLGAYAPKKHKHEHEVTVIGHAERMRKARERAAAAAAAVAAEHQEQLQ